MLESPRKGTMFHHIVEQTSPARDDKIRDALIDGPDNLVRIPRLKHWEITGWYMSGNKTIWRPNASRISAVGKIGMRDARLDWRR